MPGIQRWTAILVGCWTCSLIDVVFATEEVPKLILISIDGLRYDFITPHRMPNLYMLSRNGVFLERGLKVQVHTVTASNHYSIVTGLYQESHGIIDNEFWDPVFNETYDLWNFTGNSQLYWRSKQPRWYEGTTPIWQTNEEEKYTKEKEGKNRRRSGSYYWPMGDCPINNKTIARNLTWLDYGNVAIWRDEVDGLIKWLTDEKEPINFLLYYNAQPDHQEHSDDVYGSKVDQVLLDIDSMIEYLVDRLRAVSLWDKINLILTADHGHTNIPDLDHILAVGDYLDFSKIILNGRTIFPKNGSGVTVDEIYENLTRARNERKYPMQVWKKEQFPVHYHYTNNRRIGPVIVYEELNYILLFYGDAKNFTKNKSIPFSSHGWLNDYAEMRAFFVAYGPAFKSRFLVQGHEDIENVDLYPLMCKILGIDPLPNNGSLERIGFILRDDTGSKDSSSPWGNHPINFTKKKEYIIFAIALVPIGLLALLGILFISNLCQRRRRQRTKTDEERTFAYRRLRNSSPESCIDEINRVQKRLKPGRDRNGTPEAPETKSRNNGNTALSSRSKLTQSPHRLVPLSGEEQSSDENEL